MSQPSHGELIAAYLDSFRGSAASSPALGPEQLRARPVPGKWSTLDVVCHLVDSEQAWCHRMKRVIAEDRPLLIGYDESRFTAALDYSQSDLEEELALLEGMRRQMARTLRAQPESAWSRTGVHSERADDARRDAAGRGQACPSPHYTDPGEAEGVGTERGGLIGCECCSESVATHASCGPVFAEHSRVSSPRDRDCGPYGRASRVLPKPPWHRGRSPKVRRRASPASSPPS